MTALTSLHTEAPSHGLPAIAYDRRSAGAEAYWKVAMELVERT